MNLYCVHCGYYDEEVGAGVFESHANYFLVAASPDEARERIKTSAEFRRKRMHIDGLQEIRAVEGYRIVPEKDEALEDRTVIPNLKYRDLNPRS